ncbi:MAG: YCF48-related protein [Thiotrichales bacterium]|nr:YCF48-related protein [Thiotrichales bacterium]
MLLLFFARAGLGGQSIIAPLAEHSLLLDITAYENKLIAVGERGHVLLSGDDGKTWQQIEVPTRSTLTGVFLLDERHAWAVGHDAVILRTTDGGRSWQRVYHDPEQERPLLDVWFSDEHNGVAIGAYGYFLQTTDGGRSWRDRTIAEEDFHLNQIAAGVAGQLIMAGEAGNIYYSEDSGAEWSLLESPYHGSFFSAVILDEDSFVVGGLRGHLFRTDDAGKNWQQLPSNSTDMLTDLHVSGPNRFVVVGLDGAVILHGPDGQLQYEFQADRKGMTAITVNSRKEFFVVGVGGVRKLDISMQEVEAGP